MSSAEQWVALMGRRDAPTDGVTDYCSFLGDALSTHGIHLKKVRVTWNENGWTAALRALEAQSEDWRGRWVLLQYTALAWSSRGFPFGALRALEIVARHGAHCAVTFHEFSRQPASQRWIDRVRGACQDIVIRRMYRRADKTIFTVPIETVEWVPDDDRKATFIPIGANIPERLILRKPTPADKEKTVAIFGVTGPPSMASEVNAIISVVREAGRSLPGLRLLLVGRGSSDAGLFLTPALRGDGVEVITKGILPAEQVAHELESVDAFLFLRGAVTAQRGSALAAIACGLPIVGYQNGRVSHPLDEAGVEWAPLGDTGALARGLVRVLTDKHRWTDLHDRNLRVQQNYFSWIRIAHQYSTVLSE